MIIENTSEGKDTSKWPNRVMMSRKGEKGKKAFACDMDTIEIKDGVATVVSNGRVCKFSLIEMDEFVIFPYGDTI